MSSITDTVPQVLNLAEARAKKIAEIRRIAERTGQEGLDINTGTRTFHMACTPDDVSLLQQANQVAKMTWEAMGLPPGSEYRTAEIKEKWDEDGQEKTRLHPEVPEAEHDAVLFQAVLYTREILLKQETLIQAVQDASTIEEMRAVRWNAAP